ncbi:MAG: 23S rRNA (guanosine-2'-O-)-methyltransferase RlmB [Turneriella sp.]|nr:23S rRNA (guanosine-2'-O-)-methyltransferase RlmB [Turneriella sp.]
MEKDFLTEKRRERIRRVLENRTRQITILLEDIYDPLNANAVLRTADGLGIQDIHAVENRHKFAIHPKVSGHAAHWLTIYRYRENFQAVKDFRIKPEGIQASTKKAFGVLKNAGYTVLATSPAGKSDSLYKLDLSKKYAIALGNERWGLSPWALENADALLALPMLGFTQSYNISVTGAMILYSLTERLRRETDNWKLSEKESEELWETWTKRKIKNRGMPNSRVSGQLGMP